jgi:hypothetical protein
MTSRIDRHDTILVLNGHFIGNQIEPRGKAGCVRMGPADDGGTDFKILGTSQRLYEAIFDRTFADGHSGISRVSPVDNPPFRQPIPDMFSGTANFSPK